MYETLHEDDNGVWMRLPVKALLAWRLLSVSLGAAGLTLLFVVDRVAGLPSVAVRSSAGAVLLWTAFELWFLLPARRRNYLLQLQEGQVILRTGRWFCRELVVPAASVLSVQYRRGPVSRFLGLSSVHVLTIADRQALGPFEDAQVDRITRFLKGASR